MNLSSSPASTPTVATSTGLTLFILKAKGRRSLLLSFCSNRNPNKGQSHKTYIQCLRTNILRASFTSKPTNPCQKVFNSAGVCQDCFCPLFSKVLCEYWSIYTPECVPLGPDAPPYLGKLDHIHSPTLSSSLHKPPPPNPSNRKLKLSRIGVHRGALSRSN